MRIENYIETQYRELLSISTINEEFSDLYIGVSHTKLREILSTLHYDLISLFRTMNERLPTGENGSYFWADQSRSLIATIEMILGLFKSLKTTAFTFTIDDYYFRLIKKCRNFLSPSHGTTLPTNMEKVNLYYTIPIFIPNTTVTFTHPQTSISSSLKQIGNGSYANVYKYKDTFYDKYFVIKRAKKDLNKKETERFKREFEEMKEFSSPYILEVYTYDSTKNEYIMEYMDYTLDSFIQKKNSSLQMATKKNIAKQILKAFEYIHSKGRLHRDISPKNILLKEYHNNTLVVKISDFGLVKVPDSSLTSANTEFKGCYNDPSLVIDGFDTYKIQHETYALTRIVCYVLTGKTNFDTITNPTLREFISKGLNTDKSKRFQSTNEIIQVIKKI